MHSLIDHRMTPRLLIDTTSSCLCMALFCLCMALFCLCMHTPCDTE